MSKTQTPSTLSVHAWADHPVFAVDVSDRPDLREQAEAKADDLGELRHSIEDGDGNFAGILAEFVFADVFDAERRATYEYDAVRNGITVDLKTKRRSVDPDPHYEASIADYNTDQNADVYYFASYNTDTDVVTLLGYLPTDEYYERATFHEAGEIDPDNDFEYKADCYNVPYSELRQVPPSNYGGQR